MKTETIWRVVAAVIEGEDVPAVRGPLVDEIVAVEFAGNDAAEEDVVDACVVIGEDDAEALAHLEREGLGF